MVDGFINVVGMFIFCVFDSLLVGYLCVLVCDDCGVVQVIGESCIEDMLKDGEVKFMFGNVFDLCVKCECIVFYVDCEGCIMDEVFCFIFSNVSDSVCMIIVCEYLLCWCSWMLVFLSFKFIVSIVDMLGFVVKVLVYGSVMFDYVVCYIWIVDDQL